MSKVVDLFHWSGAHGERLDVAVTGYQFPAIEEGYDANWLVVQVTVSSPEASWTASSACVLAYDLLSLSRWFEEVDASAATNVWCSLEIDLMLRFLGWFHGRAAIAVKLCDQLSDPSRRQTGRSNRDLLVVWLSAEETAAARAAIGEVLRSFPPRGQHGQRLVRLMEDTRREARARRARSQEPATSKDRGLGALTNAERDLVRQCLVAAVNGPFFPDWEFGTLFGLEREEIVAVLSRWPSLEFTDPIALRAINNAIVNLVGYPHDCDAEWPGFIDAPRSEVVRVYRKFRGDPPRDPSDAT